MNTGICWPLAGLVAYVPRNTPVLALFSWRSRSDLARWWRDTRRRPRRVSRRRTSTSGRRRPATARGQFVDQIVFRRQHHVRRAEQRVGPGREHLDIAGRSTEQHRRARGPADPVALHGLDLLRPVQQFEIVQQPVRVRGDAHHPLPQPLPEHREVPALATAVGRDFLIGQHGAKPRTPVDYRVGPVDQSIRVDHIGPLIRPTTPAMRARHRESLCPNPTQQPTPRWAAPCSRPRRTTRCRSAGRSTASTCSSRHRSWRSCAGVVPEPQPAELAAEIDDVRFGAGPWMRAGLNRVLLGGQPEGVEAQGMQHIAARHPVIARVDVGGDVAQRVPDVQALTRRVREHVLHEHLVHGHYRPVLRCQRTHRVGHVERARLHPRLLPGALDLPGHLRRVAVLRGGLGSHLGVGGPAGLSGRRFCHVNRV